MRILIDYRPALRERSGVGEYTHRLTQALVQVKEPGDDVAIFSSSWKDRLSVPPDLEGVGVVDSRVPVRVLSRLWHRNEWPPVEWLAGKTFDVVHSARPTLVPTSTAAQVVTVHDLDFLNHPERNQADVRREYVNLVQEHAVRADHVVAISAHTAGEVEHRLGVSRSRITICRPGAPAWAPRAVTPGDRQGAPYVLFVGTLEPRKNVGLLLEAYARLLARRRDLPRLVLAGRALPESRAWLDAIARPPLAPLATYLGYVPDVEREDLFRGARALVLPSFNEGFGLPVLEAMTVGVPVVAANRGAIPEVVGDAGLLVEPDDAEGLAVAIERLLDEPALAESCRARGLRRARLFDWGASARALREAYTKAIVCRQSRAGRRS